MDVCPTMVGVSQSLLFFQDQLFGQALLTDTKFDRNI